jgi:hypothetical protein
LKKLIAASRLGERCHVDGLLHAVLKNSNGCSVRERCEYVARQ